LQSLCELTTDEAVLERIGQLPAKLEDLYVELYEKLTNSPAEADRLIAKNALSWLLCAQWTLTSTEFLTAISMTPRRRFGRVSKDQVLKICRNLVVFDTTLDTFRFAHLSVREFLEKHPEYDITAINCLAAETCLFKLVCAAPNPASERFLSEHGQPLARESPLSDDFGEYSTIYWAVHCQLAAHKRAQGVLRDFFLFFLSNESDPTSPFTVWTNQLRRSLYSDKRHFDERLENSIAVSAGPLFVACSFDFSEVIGNQVAKRIFQTDLVNSQGLTALEVAANHGSCEAISVLLTDQLTPVTRRTVKAAARNWDSGKEVMTLLLDRRGTDIQITEEVVEAAAGNWRSGKEVMMLLLDRRGTDVQIMKEVVKAAAGNWDRGKVMTLLLDRRGTDIQITEEVVKAAAGNRDSGKVMMTLLLDRRGTDVQITEEVVKAAAGNWDSGKEVMTLLLDRRGTDVQITEEVVKAAAGNGCSGKEVITLLLDRRGTDVQITEEVVKAAAQNERSGKEVMTLLLDRWLTNDAHPRHEDIPAKHHIALLQAAACIGHQEIMTQLLQAGVNINTDIEKLGIILHIAVYEGHNGMVQMLIENGANINSRDYHDWTPYTIALMSRQDIILSILSKYGCETSAGFAPTGLVKCTTSSEVVIYDGDKAATTGLLLIRFVRML
jgi:ankyrin repeat protein